MSKMSEEVSDRVHEFTKHKVHDFADYVYHAGYETGYEDGQKDKPSVFYEQYKKGLNDAWECAKKIACDNGLTLSELDQIFHHSGTDTILSENSPEEAIAKIKQYEAEKEKTVDNIKVGDMVYLIDPTHLSIVTALLDDGRVVLMSSNGTWWTERASFLHKTGNHYSELEIIFSALKGE